MSRLTKKDINGYDLVENEKVYSICGMPLLKETVHKLGKLEDLEEELGCPLDVVFKAMTMGIMLKNSDEFWEHNYSESDEKYVYFSTEEISLKNWQCHGIDNVTNSFQINFGDDNEFCVYLKDYGKRWWLKGEKNE